MSLDFRLAAHLPNLRPGRQPASPDELPRQRNGVTPQMHGRYPDYNVLDEVEHWDEVTRRLVLERVEHVPPIRFFTVDEARTLGAFCDIVMAQDREPRIPVLNMVDAKLFAGELDGFVFEDLPDDGETWRRVAVGLDAAASQHGAAPFATAPHEVQRQVVDAFSQGELRGQVWDELPPGRAWSVVMRAVLARSTRIRGRGTRSASEDRRIREGTPGSAPASARAGRERRRSSATPWRTRKSGGSKAYERARAAHDPARCAAPARQRLGLPARRAPPGRAPRADGPLRRRFLGRSRHRRRRRRGRHAGPAARPAGVEGGGVRRRPVLGPRRGLGLRRSRLTQAVLDRQAGDRRAGSGRAGEEQLRQGGRWLDGPLRRVLPPLSSLGLRGPHARRGRRGLADLL